MQAAGAVALRYGPATYRATKYLTKAIRNRIFRQAVSAGKKAYQYGVVAKGAYDTVSKYGQFTPQKRRSSVPVAGPSKKTALNFNTASRNAKRKLKYGNARYAKLNGTYGGSFALTNRKEALLNREFVQKGMTTTVEAHGLIDDPNCCYVMHSAMAYKPIIKLIAYSLARKLFVRADFFPTSLVETIPTLGLNCDSLTMVIHDQFFISMNSYTPTGTGDCTIGSFGAVIATELFKYTKQQASPDDRRVPTWITLQQTASDTGGANNNKIHLSKLCLLDEVLYLKATSDMKIQNRSNSASGSGSVDDVSNNPLVGRAYTFNYLPKAYNPALDQFSHIDSDYGVKLLRADEFTMPSGGNYMKEPPIPKIFRNCKKSSVVRLEPGQIKHYMLKEVVQKNVLKWLEGIAFNIEQLVSRLNCQVNLIALEDVINVNEEQLITLAYECEKKMYVFTKTKPKVATLTDFVSTEVDNINP